MSTSNAAAPARGARRRQADLERLAWLMDSSIRLPTGHRIGLDGIVGLIPGFGDAMGALVSGYFVVAAVRLGAPAAVTLRMSGNVLLELLLGSIPVFGDIFDLFFKANVRNYRLLERYQSEPRRVRSTSAAVLVGAGLLIAGLIVAALAAVSAVFSALWHLLVSV